MIDEFKKLLKPARDAPKEWFAPVQIRTVPTDNDLTLVTLEVLVMFHWSDKIVDEVDEQDQPVIYKSGFIMEVIPKQKFLYDEKLHKIKVVGNALPKSGDYTEIYGIDEENQMNEPEVREVLADTQHEIWSHWMRYMFSVGQINADGSWTMPAHLAQRWQRQMNTAYQDLMEKERNSDREQADKIIATLERVRTLL